MKTKDTPQNPIENDSQLKKPSKVWAFIKKHKYYALLIALLIVSIIWHFVNLSILKSKFQDQKTSIENTYKFKLDSLNTNRLQLTAKTFSWAIRSELLRNNSEQINLFFNDFIKNESIEKLQFINSENNTIEVSTDKKDEGTADVKYTSIDKQLISQDSTSFELATPISGLNSKIGVFVMKVKNLNNK